MEWLTRMRGSEIIAEYRYQDVIDDEYYIVMIDIEWIAAYGIGWVRYLREVI